MGDLPEEEITQPDWYIHFKVVPLTGFNVNELLELREKDEFAYTFWVTRALALLKAEAEAQELIRYAKSRES